MKVVLALLSLVPFVSAVADTCGNGFVSGDTTFEKGETIEIVKQTGTNVTFSTVQVFKDDKLCMYSVHYLTKDGFFCPYSPNADPGYIADHTALCDTDGYATVKVYVYDPEFTVNPSPPTTEKKCEQTPYAYTYEKIYKIPCTKPDECEDTPKGTCLKPLTPTMYNFDEESQADDWLFGADAYVGGLDGALVLGDGVDEVSRTFDVATNGTFFVNYTMMVTFDSLDSTSVFEAKIGPYYLNLSPKLELEDGSEVNDFYGEFAMYTTVKAGVYTFNAGIPKKMWEDGEVSVGIKSAGTGTATVTNVGVVPICFEDGKKKPAIVGGDPHFARWDRDHLSFHGECDLVMVSSEDFHDKTGLDLHVRTKIEDYFSYIETAVLRIGSTIVEFHKEHFFVGGIRYKKYDLPMTFGEGSHEYTISKGDLNGKNEDFHMYYNVDLGRSSIIFKFYKKFLTVGVDGHQKDFGTSIGLLGDFDTGDMLSREGHVMNDADEYGFEWQVNPKDPKLFLEDRAPQLPYERCRMPTAARPARRHLRGDPKLLEAAKKACAHVSGSDFDLCTDDVMTTGDVELATMW